MDKVNEGNPNVIHRDMKSVRGKHDRVMKAMLKAVVDSTPEESLEKIVERLDKKHILDLRKELVACVREGMYERKDKELDIIRLAAYVWYIRLDAERQQAIMNEWDA